jgi:hypothetical protein
MAAPLENQFWKFRSKHGRNKLFETPELMWEAACEYFEWCEANPLIEIDYRGKDAEKIELPKMRPFTLHGLCFYLNCNTSYFRNFKNQDRAKAEDFSSVIANIEEVIYNQKFSGAATGFFNANLISRDLGLSEKIAPVDTEGNALVLPQIVVNVVKPDKDE